MINLKFCKWLKWVKKIKNDTHDMLVNKTIHDRYLEIVKNNNSIQKPADFREWIIRNYGGYIVMAIRRQLDTDRDVISLKRLLRELEENPQLLTKKWYRTLYKDSKSNFPMSPQDWADSDFEKHAGKLEHFDPNIAKVDLERLDKLGRNITRYANKQIAHGTNVKATVTFKEIDKFLDEYEAILTKYILLFTASGYSSLYPVFQYSWDDIFKEKWIK